jgi:hypothetical protein
MKHPFRIAIENRVAPAEFRKLFSPDVVIFAPILTKPVIGLDKVLNILNAAVKIASPIEYTLEVSDPAQTFLFWHGKAGRFTVEAVTILKEDEHGLISEIRVVMRPWPIVTIFRNAMYKELSTEVPADYWELQEKPAPTGKPRVFTPIALKPIELADDITLHSPMLAKGLDGKKLVVPAVHLAHAVQSASSYTSIIATPELRIELFDCDADGYPMEGMWVSKINPEGKITELTVYLRPYSAVTVLRNNSKALAEKTEEFAFLGKEYWELPQNAVEPTREKVGV